MSAVDEVLGGLQTGGFPAITTSRRSASVAPRATAALVSRKQWERRFRSRLRVTDTLLVVLVTALATVAPVLVSGTAGTNLWTSWGVPVITAATWMMTLGIIDSRNPAILGSGAVEYTRVLWATGTAFGALAILSVIFELDGLRPQLLIALPVGALVMVTSRWLWRRWLISQRAAGRYSSRTVVVGSRDDVEYAIHTLGADGRLGYSVVGTVLLDEDAATLHVDTSNYPVVTGENAAPRAATLLNADTLIVAGQPQGDPTYIKRLAWELEGTAAELVLSSRIADVAGPRMSLRPVEGMPLIHVSIPTFEGGRYLVKRVMDVVASAAFLLAFSPVMLAIALAIKIDNPGPVFFHQERVGRDGKTFRMVKFRSMRVGAEAELAQLVQDNEGAGPLFKMKDDPRVTRIGKILRRYSLDEVPQFLNVLRGDMSIVGPRPPLPSEVTAYNGTVFRRLYIKPGITGPWQVGGRSDLSWEESVRLDLRYVENWSVVSDIVLMWRTLKVMIKPEGAY